MTLHRIPPLRAPETVVCLGVAREVQFGQVRCPRQTSISVSVRTCTDCRLLTWSDNDRRRDTECSTEPV
jgi:hypothetical protein